MCGTPGLKTELVRDPFIYGAGSNAVELSADVPVHTCPRCSVSFTGEEAERVRHEAVCRHLGVLTPDKIRALRARHHMSRAAFARLTGFGEATLARWERREIVQNTSSDRYLRLLEDPVIFRRLYSMSERADSTDTEQAAEVGVALAFVVLTPRSQASYRMQSNHWSLRRVAA